MTVKMLGISGEDLKTAANCIRSGQLIAFPTETVYGLGANALDDAAVAAIFEAKGRPSFNPLIIHVPSLEAARQYVQFNALAEKLARSFWPGALTLVLPRTPDCPVSLLASAGLDTLAIRVPGHRLALEFLSVCNRPLAAPSANRSGGISPTKAEHVRQSLGDKVSAIIDDGPCRIGVESTVVGFDDDQAVLLRPGGITADALETCVGPLQSAAADGPLTSPGMLQSHYAPNASVRLNAKDKQPGECFLGFGRDQEHLADVNLSESGDLTEATARLFSALYFLDEITKNGIAVGPIPEIGLGVAINDRLRRAAAPRP